MSAVEKPMTKGEREELKRLARERARVAKADTERRAADLKALFEMQMMDHYGFDTVENWEAASAAAQQIALRAEEEIREAFRKVGLADGQLSSTSSQIFVAPLTSASTLRCVRRSTRSTGRLWTSRRSSSQQVLTSALAIEFLASMPTVEVLMPDDIIGQVLAQRERPAIGPGSLGEDIEF